MELASTCRAEAELLGHHRVDSELAVCRDHVDYALELVAVEAVRREDLPDLLALVRDETLDQPQAYAAAALTAPSDEVPAAEVAPAVSSAT